MGTNRLDIAKLKERGETPASRQAFLDYSAMGPHRSLGKLAKLYRDPDKYVQDNRKDDRAPPTRQLSIIQMWSSAFEWQFRLKGITDEQLAVIEKERSRALALAMREKFACPTERIHVLNEIATMLVDHLRENKLLTVVMKQIGAGKKTRMVEEAKIDTPAISALRGIFEDLSKESGGRVKVKRFSHEFPDGVPSNQTVFVLPEVKSRTPPTPDMLPLGDVMEGELKDVTPAKEETQ